MSQITASMKPHCVGRYLIDMPAVVTEIGTAKFGGVSVLAHAMTLDEFNEASEERESKMKATKSAMGFRFLYDYGVVPNQKRTQYFVSLGDWGSPSDAKRMIDAYKWDKGYEIKLSLEATDFSNSKFRDMPAIKLMPTQNDLPEKKRFVFDLLMRLEGRPNDMVPSEAGTCFFGGFLKGKATDDEEIDSAFVLPDKLDVSFNLQSFTDLRPEKTLLQRVHGSEMRDLFKATNGRLLRSDTITLEGGLKADEALMSGKTPATVEIHGNLLSLEANYGGGVATPYLLLDMMNGYPNELLKSYDVKQASLTEAEAIDIWEKVSRSLRARPNAF